MKKLLVYLMSLMFLMSITIIGKPATGEYKGEDFFVVDYGTPDGAIDLGGHGEVSLGQRSDEFDGTDC